MGSVEGGTDRDASLRPVLVLASAAEHIMRLPDIQLRLKLSATGPRGTRELGEYIYNHTAPR